MARFKATISGPDGKVLAENVTGRMERNQGVWSGYLEWPPLTPSPIIFDGVLLKTDHGFEGWIVVTPSHTGSDHGGEQFCPFTTKGRPISEP